MVTIDDLFIFDKAIFKNLNTSEFYVLPRINGKKKQPSYSGLFTLSSRKVSPEKLLQVIGAEKAHLNILHTIAGLPVLLPYDKNNKLTSFDFAAVKKDADTLSLLYDYIDGSRRGDETILNNLFEFDSIPFKSDLLFNDGLFLPKIDKVLTMNIFRNQTVYYNTFLTKISDYNSNHAITFRLYTFINLRPEIICFKIDYWLHNKSNNIIYPLDYNIFTSPLDAIKDTMPNGQLVISKFFQNTDKFFGYFSETKIKDKYRKTNLLRVTPSGYIEGFDAAKKLNMDKTISYLLEVAQHKRGFNPDKFALCDVLSFL